MAENDSTQQDEAATTEPTETTTEVAGEEALGDPGKRALDAMKVERNKAKAERDQLRAELESFKAKAEGREAEYAAEQERRKVREEALASANARILKAEIRAAAAAKLTNPEDALAFTDLSSLEVGDDGAVDRAAIAAAIDDLITRKPYLAVQDAPRFQGGADGGARNGTPKTRAELIAEAEAAGDWKTATNLKVMQLTEPAKS